LALAQREVDELKKGWLAVIRNISKELDYLKKK
jgi:hypothetical protein